MPAEPTGWAIGIDLGGTNVRAAEVAADGRVGRVIRERVDRDPAARPFAQLDRIVAALAGAAHRPPVGIGLGVTGPVDVRTGVIDNPHTLPAAYQGDVGRALAAHASRIVVENDANAAALGEALRGAGRGRALVACITVGTGIGVGVVDGGRLRRGAAGHHPEAGHLVVADDGPACYCGARGCVESIASGSAVARAARAAGVIDASGTARDVYDLVATNGAAAAIVERAQRALAAAARSVAVLHGADIVVLSGGALGPTEPLLGKVRAMLAPSIFQPPGGASASIGSLGDLAGCIGAASLVLPA